MSVAYLLCLTNSCCVMENTSPRVRCFGLFLRILPLTPSSLLCKCKGCVWRAKWTPPMVEAKRNTTGLKATTRSKKNLRGRYHTKERGDELKHMSKSFTRINIENCNLAVTNWYSSWVSCFPIPWKPFWTPEVSRFQKGTYGWSKMQLFCNLATASCPWGNSECLLCWHHNLW